MNIQPENQTVEKCLKGRPYHIDFYQREYVWKKNIVEILLDDVFFTFETAYEEHKEKDLTPAVLAKYNWYYLNIYITNNINGKEYIVDGQQRLTTLTLIAIKLLHLAQTDIIYFENILDTLEDCVYGKDKFKGNVFWIDHSSRKKIMQHLLGNKPFSEEYNSVTEKSIYDRFGDISKYLDEKKLPKEKLKAFIMYFLERLVLVELKIDKNDTPMIFEVINDRGVALKPFEILKGKLVGRLDKDDTEKYNELWEISLNKLRGIEDYFFIDYLKGKYIYKRNADIEKSINNQYHRYIFENNDIANKLQFRKNDEDQINNIKNFIENDLTYYANLYARIRKNDDIFLSYNNDINDLSGQYQNIIASCKVNDSKENAKIKTISKEIDRLYMLLILNGIYNSNNYQEISYAINDNIRDIEIEKYRDIFDKELEYRIKSKFDLNEFNSLLDYDRFKTKGYDNIGRRPIRYFFARVEKYLCDKMGKEMERSVYYISTKTGHKTGYHIEHILSRNDENIKHFETEDEFEIQRNKFGGLLLLYNKDNILSSNERYFEGKSETYNNSLFWGRTLIKSFYHKTNSRFIEFNNCFKEKTQMEFKYVEKFDKDALNYRSKLLYEIVKQIWDVR